MNVEWHGEQYVLAPDQNGHAKIGQDWVIRQTAPIRTQGIQSRKDDASINHFVYRSFPMGIGWDEIRRDTGWGVGGLKDTNCWTGGGPTTLGKLEESQTTGTPVDHLVKAINFKGDLWGLFNEEYSSGATTDIVVRKYGATSDNWTGGGDVENGFNTTVGARGFDMVSHKGYLFVIRNGAATYAAANDEVVFGISRSAVGTSFADASGSGFPTSNTANRYLYTTVTRRDNFDDDMARLLSFGNVLIAALYYTMDSTDGTGEIEFFKTVDADASSPTWTNMLTLATGYGPKALVSWMNLQMERSPVLITDEGVWAINMANDVVELIYELDGDPNNGRWSTVGNDGALYVGLGSGEVIRLAITSPGNLDVMVVGPPGDGLVTARTGHPNYILRTPSKWLLVAYGGHAASRDASIFMIDTSKIMVEPETERRFMPWHHLYQHSTEDRDIIALAYSTEDNATPRVHFAVEGSAASVLYHIEEPFVHPNLSSTVKYQLTGALRLPDDDLGDPQHDSMIIQLSLDGEDLTSGSGSTDEFIQGRYGLERESDTAETLTAFTSGTNSVAFGDSSEGESARKIGLNILFDRGTGSNLNTPKMHELALDATNLYIDKEKWDFTVDIELTARVSPPTKVQDTPIQTTIINNIRTNAESGTMLTFTIGGLAQTLVRVPNDAPPTFDLRVIGSHRSDVEGYKTGFVTVRVEEGR